MRDKMWFSRGVALTRPKTSVELRHHWGRGQKAPERLASVAMRCVGGTLKIGMRGQQAQHFPACISARTGHRCRYRFRHESRVPVRHALSEETINTCLQPRIGRHGRLVDTSTCQEVPRTSLAMNSHEPTPSNSAPCSEWPHGKQLIAIEPSASGLTQHIR
jgi:hypothetical protein